MYIKYKNNPKNSNTEKVTIIDMTQVFSIEGTKRFQKVDETKDKSGNVISLDIIEDGYVTIYKSDKTYHQFGFGCYENVDEFINQLEECLGKDKGDSIKEIIIDHRTNPIKRIVS